MIGLSAHRFIIICVLSMSINNSNDIIIILNSRELGEKL